MSTDPGTTALALGSRGLLGVPDGPLRVPPRPAARPATPPSPRLSLIIPTYNEARNVGPLVQQLTSALGPVVGEDYELIVVDDDSPDRTWEQAQKLSAAFPRLRVMRRQGERGLSSAVIRGWQAARGEVLAVIDGDLQHPPEVVARLWAEMERGADLAVASRNVAGGGVSDWALHRRVLSRGAQLLGLLLLPEVIGRVSDPMSGYFMVRRSAVEGVELKPVGYKILVEVMGRGRVRWISEVGYVFRERQAGVSKASAQQSLEYLMHLARLRLSTLPIKRFFRFCVVGFSGVFVDMGFLYLLSDPSTLGWGLTRSKLIAAELAIINNFLWNDAWTFGDVTPDQRSQSAKLRRFLKFNLICGAGLALNVVLLNVMFNSLGINRYLANAIAIGLVTVWNFALNSRLAWRLAETDAAGARRG